MTFRETFYNVKQLMVNRLIDFGLEGADIDMGWTSLLMLAQDTRITIDVPLDLTYSDNFNITGTLETATYRRLSYQTLILEVDGNEVERTETDIDGTYSFTTAPTSMGNHSFQVIFEGTNVYQESESSIINRITGKETSVINVQTTPTAHINGSVIITGTLESDDAELIKEVTIKLDTPSGTTLTETTNQYGQFSFTVTNISSFDGVYADCYFEGDNYYAESSIRIPIPVYQETLSLTSDKNILSYADEEYATLSVQYQDTGDMNLGSGKQIDIYQIYEVDDIDLNSDKDILSYTDNEYTTITAQLTKNNKDVKASGIPITFSRPICDFDETNVGTGLNKHLGDSYSFTSDGIIKIGDSTNYIEFDYEREQYNAYGAYTGIIGDSLFENDVVSLENGSLCINGVALIDITDYPLLDFTTLYAYTTSSDSSSLYIEDVLSEVNTDGSGAATIRYDSQGIGDFSIKAICGNIASNEIYIEDMLWYDLATQDNVSKYTANSGTSITYDSTEQAYLITLTGRDTVSTVSLPNFEISNNVKISGNFKLHPSNTNSQGGIGLLNDNTGIGGKITHSPPIPYYSFGICNNNKTSYGTDLIQDDNHTSNDIKLNQWYTIELEIIDNNITGKLYDGNILVSSLTTSSSVLSETDNNLQFFIGYSPNQKAYIKNIKMHEL